MALSELQELINLGDVGALVYVVWRLTKIEATLSNQTDIAESNNAFVRYLIEQLKEK